MRNDENNLLESFDGDARVFECSEQTYCHTAHNKATEKIKTSTNNVEQQWKQTVTQNVTKYFIRSIFELSGSSRGEPGTLLVRIR